MFVSIIVPVYNQADSLSITLKFFNNQSYPMDKFEVVVIDDGSTDSLHSRYSEGEFDYLNFSLNYIRQENSGRSVARNKGVANAKGDLIVFCDADRFPERDFIKKYVEGYEKYGDCAFIGCSLDYFGLPKLIKGDIEEIDFKKVVRFSRKPSYYTKIMNLFGEDNLSNSKIQWAAFLVGNSCLSKENFYKAGGFDENFKTWGFEHFELALRLQNCGVKFCAMPDISNYHIPHPRGDGYYRKMISDSIQVFKKKHSNYHVEFLGEYLLGDISLQEFEEKYSGEISKAIKDLDPIIYKMK